MEVYLMAISEAEMVSERECREMFPERFKRAKGYLKREDSLRCIGAGVMLSMVTGVREDEISFNEWGKPYAEGKHFNISHSGDYVLLAVDDGPIGADIEIKGPIERRVAKLVFTPDELEWLEEDFDERFYLLWTMKESVIKLDGRGFSLPPESFSVLHLLQNGQCGNLYGKSLEYDGHVISLCSHKPVEDTEVNLWRICC